MKNQTFSILSSAVASLMMMYCGAVASEGDVPVYSVQPKAKKLIHFGWREPKTIAHFKAPLADLDGTCPVDGIGIRPVFELKRDGKIIRYNISRALGSPEMLTHEDFAEWIPVLRRLQQTRMKHNFVLTGSVLFNADWFDDGAWARTLNNFETLTWLARESQFEGICLDIEAYPHSGQPFRFRPELGHTFRETQVQVRKRGAEWVKAINKQFPGIVLFTFFWTSQCKSEQDAAHPEMHYMGKTGLQTAFFNGVYDGAPLDMKIIDGNENVGYHACVKEDFDAAVGNFLRFSKAWIDPRNHAKYDKITQLAMALYVDSYVPRKNAGHWNLFEKTDNPTALLYQNIENGMKYSDEYAWLWAENGTFWPKITGNKNCKYWNDRLPYAMEAIVCGKNPVAAALKYAGENILVNPNFQLGDSGAAEGPGQVASGIKGWSVYQNPQAPKGTFLPENGMVRFKDCGAAYLTQAVRTIKQGKRYILTARAKVEGTCAWPSMNFFYRDAKGQGLWTYNQNAIFVNDQDGWQKASIVFTVPDDKAIATFTVVCGVNGTGKAPDGDKGVLIDDIELRPVAFPWDK